MAPSQTFSSTLLFLLLLGFASSDLNKDRDECSEKLIGLAGCIPYVGGDANSPTIDCCSGLKVVLENSRKCICILIKDRNDPDLGIKINATRAVQLPGACHAPSNITACIDLLHLAPDSPDAKEFEGLGKSTKTNNPTPVPSGRAKAPTSSSAQEKSDGGRRNSWLVTEVVLGILSFPFTFYFLFNV